MATPSRRHRDTMTTQILCCICWLLALSWANKVDSDGIEIIADTGWQLRRQYEYAVSGSTAAGFRRDGSDAAVELQATLTLQRMASNERNERQFVATVEHARIAVQQHREQVPHNGKQYFQSLPLAPGGWLLNLSERGVATLSVNNSLSKGEVNIIKALASRLVLNTGGAKELGPVPDIQFSVMEESVTGRCETSYEVATLGEELALARPQVAPLLLARADVDGGRLVRVIKSRDFERCERRPGTQRHAAPHVPPAYLSTEEVIIQGTLEDYLIHSSTVLDQVTVGSLALGETQGSVETQLNITLVGLRDSKEELVPLGNLRTTDLVFESDTTFILSSLSPKWENIETKRSSEDQERDSDNSNVGLSFEDGKEDGTLPSVGRENVKLENTKNNLDTNNTFQLLLNISKYSPLIPPFMRSFRYLDKFHLSNTSSKFHSLELPLNVPLRPFFDGYSSDTTLSKDRKYFARKLILDVTSGLKDPNKVTQLHSLKSFSTLVDLLGIFNYQQLMNISEEFELERYDNKGTSSDDFVWSVWREAVAQVGSGPTLLLLTSWVDGTLTGSQKILTHGEAARILASLPAVALKPDDAYMQRLFAVVQASETARSPGVHRAAILSLAELLRRTGPRGRMPPGRRFFLHDVFVPFASRGLRRAVAAGDVFGALTYARALGATGSPRALLAFKPFLEGTSHAPAVLRLVLVGEAARATRARPRLMRRTLLPLCLNAREAPSVRAAATYALVRGRPGAAVLRRLARAAAAPAVHRHVRAAVRSALEAAAVSKDPDDAQLAADAQTAIRFLNTDVLSLHYSRTWSTTERITPSKIYKSYFDFIGSDDSILPKAAEINFLSNFVGEESELAQMGFMTSSIDQLLGAIQHEFGSSTEDAYSDRVKSTRAPYRSRSKAVSASHMTTEWLKNVLGIREDTPDALVGSLYFEGFGESYLLPFDRSFGQAIVNWTASVTKEARSTNGMPLGGVRLRAGVAAAYYRPSALGVPTFVREDAPSVAMASGGLTLGDAHSKTIEARLQARLLYSTQATTRFGFSLPFIDFEKTGGSVFESGLGRSIQLHLPLDMHLKAATLPAAKALNLTVALLHGRGKEHLLHYSAVSYDCRQSSAQPTPAIPRGANISGSSATDEEETTLLSGRDGVALRAVSAGTPPTSAHLLTLLPLGPALASTLRGALPIWAAPAPAPGPAGGSPPARFDLFFVNRSAAAVSLALVLRGGVAPAINATLRLPKQTYITHAEYIQSVPATPTAPETTRLHVAFQRLPAANRPPFQASFTINGSWANVPLTAFEEVLLADHTSNITAEFTYGKSAISADKISLQCHMARSEERLLYLRRLPMAAQCARTSAAGDRLLSACRNITMRAGYLDLYNFTAQVPSALRNTLRTAILEAWALGYSYFEGNIVHQPSAVVPTENLQSTDSLSGSVTFRSGGLKKAHIAVQLVAGADTERAAWTFVPVSPLLRPLLVVHPRYPATRRFARRLLHSENTPTCVVDMNTVNTFDNSTYPVRLGNCWRVALTTVSDRSGRRGEPVAVLVRDSLNGRKEVWLLFGDNAEQSSGGVWQRLPGGALLLDLPRMHLRLLLDGPRLVVVAFDALRAHVRGLCGTLSGRPEYDFTTPHGCLLSPTDPRVFLSAWTVPDKDNRSCMPAPSLSSRRCVRHSVAPTLLDRHDVNLVFNPISDSNSESMSDSDYDSAADSDLEPILLKIPEYDSKSQSLEEEVPTAKPTVLPWMGSCMRSRVRLEREGTRFCFSRRPLPECSEHCTPARLVRKSVSFFCTPYGKAAQYWADKLMRGEDSDFSKKPANRWIVLSLPLSCV